MLCYIYHTFLLFLFIAELSYEDSGSEYVPNSEDDGMRSSDDGDSVCYPALKPCQHPQPSKTKSKNLTIHCARKNNGKRVYDKRNVCKFCRKLSLKVSKHLFGVHKDERDVALILSKPVGSKERLFFLEKLRNEGNFQHNCDVRKAGHGEIVPWRSPSDEQECDPHDYIPCEFCLGFFHKKELWRHEKNCKFQISKKTGRKVQSRSIALLPTDSEHSNGLKEIFHRMSADNISRLVKNDYLIGKFGERLVNKLGHFKHLKNHISQKVRELARLLEAVRKEDSDITDLRSVISPGKFPVVVSAVKKLCGYESQRNTFANPSLAKKLGHSLKKCCHILRSEALIAGDDQLQVSTAGFLNLCDSDWKEHITFSALETLQMNKSQKAHVLPLTEDVKKLTQRMAEERERCAKALRSSPSAATWHLLAKVVLANIIMFNRRRSGEASRMLLSQFEAAKCRTVPEDDVTAALSDFERSLLEHFTRVVVRGKRGRIVPVLLTETMRQEIILLNNCRSKAGIDPQNMFVFARPYFGSVGHLAGHTCLREVVDASSLEHPEHITGTQLRQHLATVTQILNLSDHELEQVCTFLGHNISVHREFYRIPQDTYQLAKVSRLLLLAEQGQIHQFQGQSLNDIQLDSVLNFQDHENQDAEDTGNESDEEGTTPVVAQASRCETPQRVSKAPRLETPGNKVPVLQAAGLGEPVSSNEAEAMPPAKKYTKKGSHNNRDFLSDDQISAVQTFFHNQIHDLVLPGKKECLKMIEQMPVVQGKTWQKIKWTVRNAIEKKKRQQ